jgi:hypothetical protein
VGGNDFAAAGGGAAEIGPEEGAEIFLPGRILRAQGEDDFVADKAQKAFAGGGGHGWIKRLHAKFLP